MNNTFVLRQAALAVSRWLNSAAPMLQVAAAFAATGAIAYAVTTLLPG